MFPVKLLDGLGNLAQHNQITADSTHLAAAYAAGFAHAMTAERPSPESYLQNRTEQEKQAYLHGVSAWEQMDRYQQEDFRIGESVKAGVPLGGLTGNVIRDSLMDSWAAHRMGNHRGRDE